MREILISVGVMFTCVVLLIFAQVTSSNQGDAKAAESGQLALHPLLEDVFPRKALLMFRIWPAFEGVANTGDGMFCPLCEIVCEKWYSLGVLVGLSAGFNSRFPDARPLHFLFLEIHFMLA